MNAKSIANHYGQLTPEERFRLIVAAGDRGDEAERDRLTNASKWVTVSRADYLPYSLAFQELTMLVFIELLDEAARYLDSVQRFDDDREFFGGAAEEDGDEAAEEADATADAELAEVETGERPARNRSLDLMLAAGYMLRTKIEGWKLFCERLAISPFGLWPCLPGSKRLRGTLKAVEGTPDRPGSAFTRKGMVRWMNGIRAAGEAALTDADIVSAERSADSLDAMFRERVSWWGGE